jgi:hypothetical protein
VKRCARCKKRRPFADFTKNASSKDGLNHSCKLCHRAYTRQHYAANKSYYLAKSKQHNAKIKAFIDSLKVGPCSDCKNTFNPWQMDFDHARGEKEILIAYIRSRGLSRKRLLEELRKCDLVCANCHRQRTHERRVGLRE